MAAKAITQAQVIASLADAGEVSKKQAKAMVEALCDMLVKNEKVATPMGIFSKKVKPARPARPGVNPFTGENITIKARPKTTELKFRPNKAMKERVAAGK